MSEFYDSFPVFLNELRTEASAFQGGQLQHFVFNWESLTSDPKITELVTGVKLELNCDDAHLPQSFPSQPSLQAHETTITDREIEKLHEKNVISQCFSVPGQCVLPAFTRLKKRQVSKNDLKFEMFEQ